MEIKPPAIAALKHYTVTVNEVVTSKIQINAENEEEATKLVEFGHFFPEDKSPYKNPTGEIVVVEIEENCTICRLFPPSQNAHKKAVC